MDDNLGQYLAGKGRPIGVSVNELQRSRIGRQKPLRVSAKGVPYLLVRGKSRPRFVGWAFILFIATLPFEAADLSFIPGGTSITKVIGVLFFLIYLLYQNPLFGKRPFPSFSPALWFFLGYLALMIFRGLFVGRAAVQTLITVFQLIAMFWFASNMLRDAKIARTALLGYVIASAVLSAALVFHLPGFFTMEIAHGRVAALGENANAQGTHMAMAVVIMIGLHLNRLYKPFVTRVLMLILLPVLMSAMVSSGSRGAVVSLLVGCSIYLLPYRRSKQMLVAIMVACLVMVAAVYMVSTNPDFRERWEQAYYEGNFSARENIFAATTEMIGEKPIFGWGPGELGDELGFRTNMWEANDTHNLFLRVLAEVGVIGAIPFLLGLGYCLRAAAKARHGPYGLLPLAFLGVLLVSSLSGSNLLWKPFWIALAVPVGAAAVAADQGNVAMAVVARRRIGRR